MLADVRKYRSQVSRKCLATDSQLTRKRLATDSHLRKWLSYARKSLSHARKSLPTQWYDTGTPKMVMNPVHSRTPLATVR